MKLSLNQTGMNSGRRGFTLIELMVVIIIIGILAGFLLPAIGGAFRRSKEFVIQKNVTDLKGALETFKNKYGIYPIDFAINRESGDIPLYQELVSEFVDRLSSRHQYGNAGYTIFAFNASLENPYPQFPNTKDTYGVGNPALRHPGDMSATEGFVFLLGELSENAEFPLGYVSGGPGLWTLDPNLQYKRFYEFKDDKLTDLDGDGWPEFAPEAGPKMPICYFDSRTYTQLQRTTLIDADNSGSVDVTELTENLLDNIKVDELDHMDVDGGWCYPYLDFAETAKLGGQYYAFEGPETYQLISAGMDGLFGKGAGQFPGLRFSKNDDAGLIVAHRDNIVSFFETRMDAQFVTD